MFLERLAGLWRVNDPLPKTADLIVIISYAATPERLTHGSMKVATMAENLARELYPSAFVGWGAFSKNPDSEIE